MLIRSAARFASTSATAALAEGAAAGQVSVAASTSSAVASSSASASTSTLSAYMLLSRPPTIIRSPTSFEAAYHAYNSTIQRILAQPFPRDLYFKKGSAAESKFIQEEKARQRTLTENTSGTDKLESKQSDRDELASDDKGEEQSMYSNGLRKTKADEEGRTDTLERNLDRSLFLVVKGGDMGNEWTLPYAIVDVEGNTGLHKAAPNAVHSILGKDMDIWMVTTLPIGLLNKEGASAKGYIMKGHILAGQPDANLSSSKGVEYAWLTREEMQGKLTKEQYDNLSDLLSS